MSSFLFIEPLDVLYLRGNRWTGNPGDHGAAQFPPWPSLFAGALRSAMLARDRDVKLGLFTDETEENPSQSLARVLGTPRDPGSFRVSFVALGRQDGELYVPLPADLQIFESGDRDPGESRGKPIVVRRFSMVCRKSFEQVRFSPCELPQVPVLVGKEKGKPKGGYYLNRDGLTAYLEGREIEPEHCVHGSELFGFESRLGIARDRGSFTAEEGLIYTSEVVSLRRGIGFVVGVEGCPEELLPIGSAVRLGGDGRAALVQRWSHSLPSVKLAERFVALAVTPMLSPEGWLPPGIRKENDEWVLEGQGAKLVGAVVPRAEVVSGWDLAAHRPKPAQAAVPGGAVFYFQGTPPPDGYFPQALQRWALTNETSGTVWRQRVAEGFTNFVFGAWPR